MSTVRVVDSSTASVVGVCTARVTVGDRYAIDLFIVLEQCPRDLILGIDFLEQHAAQIDCSDGVVQLDLPFPANTATCAPSHLCSAELVRLSPKVATAVVLRPSSPVSDGDYVVSCGSPGHRHGESLSSERIQYYFFSLFDSSTLLLPIASSS